MTRSVIHHHLPLIASARRKGTFYFRGCNTEKQKNNKNNEKSP